MWLPIHRYTVDHVCQQVELASTGPRPVHAEGMPRFPCRFFDCPLRARDQDRLTRIGSHFGSQSLTSPQGIAANCQRR